MINGAGMCSEMNTTTGQPMQLPYDDDTANVGSLVAENVDVSTGTDFVFSQIPVNAWTFTSKIVKASWQLVQDNQFDLDNWLPQKLGVRIGRAIAPFCITGTGTAQPLGIMTNMAIGVTGATGSTLVPKYADLVNMYTSVDMAYVRPGATAWVTSPAGMSALRNVVDTQARPLIQPDLQVGTSGSIAPFSLFGYPIVLDPQIAVPAANAVSMFFGSLQDAYLIRTVQDTFTLRLTERYADFGLVGYISYLRIDGRVITQAAVKSYKNSAT
jgi:HK97 family phage major capsid protein